MPDHKLPKSAPASAPPSIRYGRRTPRTSPRVAAMVADRGLSCIYLSIISSSGLPFAELALPAGHEEDALPIEVDFFRVASHSDEIAKMAASFRTRAVGEFASAPGIPAELRLHLPWFCALSRVEAVGPSLVSLLGDSGLQASRVVVELAVLEGREVSPLLERAKQLRTAGVQLALCVSTPDSAALEACESVRPDYVHLASPARLAEPGWLFDDGAAQLLREVTVAGARVIVGNVQTAQQLSDAESLGASLFYGDHIGEARFLV